MSARRAHVERCRLSVRARALPREGGDCLRALSSPPERLISGALPESFRREPDCAVCLRALCGGLTCASLSAADGLVGRVMRPGPCSLTRSARLVDSRVAYLAAASVARLSRRIRCAMSASASARTPRQRRVGGRIDGGTRDASCGGRRPPSRCRRRSDADASVAHTHENPYGLTCGWVRSNRETDHRSLVLLDLFGSVEPSA